MEDYRAQAIAASWMCDVVGKHPQEPGPPTVAHFSARWMDLGSRTIFFAFTQEPDAETAAKLAYPPEGFTVEVNTNAKYTHFEMQEGLDRLRKSNDGTCFKITGWHLARASKSYTGMGLVVVAEPGDAAVSLPEAARKVNRLAGMDAIVRKGKRSKPAVIPAGSLRHIGKQTRYRMRTQVNNIRF